MNSRFNSVFRLFEKEFEPMLEDLKQQQVVFCYKYDSINDSGAFEVFEDHPEQATVASSRFAFGAERIKAMHDLVYNDTVWFFYEDRPGGKALEAMVAYLDEYRPVFQIHATQPKLRRVASEVPYLPGTTYKAASKPTTPSQPVLF